MCSSFISITLPSFQIKHTHILCVCVSQINKLGTHLSIISSSSLSGQKWQKSYSKQTRQYISHKGKALLQSTYNQRNIILYQQEYFVIPRSLYVHIQLYTINVVCILYYNKLRPFYNHLGTKRRMIAITTRCDRLQ